MDGETTGELPAQHSGEATDEPDEDLAGSGWTTTKQAAKVLGVSRRSVQGYVRRKILEAREEGEGVNKRFFVSIDSLNDLRARRSEEALASKDFARAAAGSEEAANLVANTGEGLRHVVDRLESRTVEATELRVRLEITERAESTVREELAEERRRREAAERRAEDLRSELRALQEAREPPESPATTQDPTPAPGDAQAATQSSESGGAPRSLWSRIFGGR
jgi:FtsZ-binding cell division protein ZapB